MNEKLDELSEKVRVHSRSMVNLTEPLATPLTSRKPLGEMVCHGCHGPIGEGAHVGSATGKNLCKFLHSPSCPGGILDDGSWKACPVGYVLGMVMSGTGFEQTLDTMDFRPENLLSSSTPAAGLPAGGVPLTSEADLLRFQRQAQGEAVRERMPGMVYAGPGGQSSALPTPVFHGLESGDNLPQSLPSEVENQVLILRAKNQQAQSQVAAGDAQLTIAGVRKSPGMEEIVGNQMDEFQQIIPSLSAAQSAFLPPKVQSSLDQQQIGSQQQELAQSEAEYAELLSQQQQMTESLRVARDAQAYLFQQQKQQQQISLQTPAWQHTVQPDNTLLGSGSQPADGQLDLQRELLLQQREQQRLQGALELQRQQYSTLLAQQQQQAALLAAQKQKFEQEQAAAKVREQREKNARIAAELKAAQQALATLQLGQTNASHSQTHLQQQAQQMFPNNTAASGTGNFARAAQANSVPVMSSSEAGDALFTPEYDFFRRPDGSTYKVLKLQNVKGPAGVSVPPLDQQQRYSPQLGQSLHQSSLPAAGTAFYEWRVNQVTGLPYKVLVQPAPHHQFQQQAWQAPQQLHSNVPSVNIQQQQQDQTMLQPQPYRSPQLSQTAGQPPGTTSGLRNSSMAQQLKEKVAGIVTLVESGGEAKKLKLLDYVKSCPAKWAKKVTLDNMNLPVYGYGVTAELTASLSGRAPEMSQEVLLAKLQHLQNTFSVCCLNTTDKEFSNYGWVLARDYAMKVQDRVNQNLTSWESLTSDVQTSDLVASQMEFPRPAEKKVLDKKNDDRKQVLCSTWNTCTTDKKCQYEVEHPDRTCLRKHECSHCRATLKQSNKHQAWKCPSK